MDVKINTVINYDFIDYTEGNSFVLELDFYSSDDDSVPEDLTDWEFTMDIKSLPSCGRSQPLFDSLTIGEGISVTGNTVLFDEIIDLPAGNYNQIITYVNSTGRVVTFERGTIQIDSKI